MVVADPKAQIYMGIAINSDQKPFNDERVRKTLSLAVDRQDVWLTEKSGAASPRQTRPAGGKAPCWPYDLPVLWAPPFAHKASKTRPGDMGS